MTKPSFKNLVQMLVARGSELADTEVLTGYPVMTSFPSKLAKAYLAFVENRRLSVEQQLSFFAYCRAKGAAEILREPINSTEFGEGANLLNEFFAFVRHFDLPTTVPFGGLVAVRLSRKKIADIFAEAFRQVFVPFENYNRGAVIQSDDRFDDTVSIRISVVCKQPVAVYQTLIWDARMVNISFCSLIGFPNFILDLAGDAVTLSAAAELYARLYGDIRGLIRTEIGS